MNYDEYDGPEHGLAVNAGLQEKVVGYSAHLWMLPSPEPSSKNPSQPPAKISFSQLGLMVGAADPMMNFPSGTVFTPYSLVRNMSDQPALVTPELWWMAGGAPQSSTLPQMTIAPHHTVNLNASALLVAAGLKNFNGSVNLILDTQAQPGGLLMSSGSVDQKNTYVFEVMTHAIAEGASRQVCYWSTANGDDTMVTLWNPADEPQDFAFTLFYSGGQYVYPIHLGPRETHVFNVSEILHSSIPDVAGNVIPAGVTEGSAEIAGSQGEHQHILVGIEAGVYNVRKAICGSPCQVCNGVTSTDILPSPFTVAVRGAAQETFYENWNTGGQSNVNATSTWSTSPSSIATVSAGLVSGVSAGSFGVSAEDNYSEPVYQAQFCAPNQQCPTVYWGSSANGTVLSLALSPTVLNMSSGDTGVTISLTISPGSASVQPAFTNSLSQNPNSSTQATLAITNPSGNVSGSYNAPVTVSNNGSNSPSGQFSVTASVNRVTSNTVDLAVPPQVLIQMIQAEAGGTNVTTMTAVAEVARNRFSSTIFGGHYTTYQNTIIPGQFATSSTTTGVEPELDIAASVFTGASAGNFCGSLSFWTPTSSQWQTVQAALQSGTTAFPANTGAPTYQAWSTSQQQIIFVPAVATQSNGAPSFLFLTQRSSSQAAAVSTSCN